MEELIGNFYQIFDSFYGSALRDYLWGLNCDTRIYSEAILFNQIGIVTGCISLLVVVLYYNVIDNPRFANNKSWFAAMFINCVLSFIYGFNTIYADLNANRICTVFLDAYEHNAVTINSCLGFGIANAIISIAIYFVFSLFAKLLSNSCKYIPF